MLLAASALAIFIGVAHSYLGEKFILLRLFRKPLPRLFGDDSFTRQTLRFAWHITTVAWFGFAALLIAIEGGSTAPGVSLIIIGATFGVTALVALFASRGRHLSWIVFAAIAGLCFMGVGMV